MSGASERANGRASGPVLQSVFLAVLDHSGLIASVLVLFSDVGTCLASVLQRSFQAFRGRQKESPPKDFQQTRSQSRNGGNGKGRARRRSNWPRELMWLSVDGVW